MSILALTVVMALAATEDTPAGRQLTSWLTAFNSSDRTSLLAYHDRAFPYAAASGDVADVESELRLGRATGGFDVRKVEQPTPVSLTAYLKERRRLGFARVRLEVDSNPPHKVLSFEIGPIPPPDELLTPEERAVANVSPAKRRRLINGIARALQAHYVYPEVAQRMVAAIRRYDAEGRYDAMTSAPLLADKVAGDLRAVSHDGHLRVMFDATLPPPPGRAAAPSADPAEFGFGPISRMEGNIAHVVLIGFVGDDKRVRQAIGGYMSRIADADALLLDLRQNGGGDPATVATVASYLFDDKPVHLNDMFRRDTGETRQFWTHAKVAGNRFGGKKPIYVLTSKRTFSGGEELAYDLQSLRRATIVGETTAGGAHPVPPYPLGGGFTIAVPWGRPINPITKTNWEGAGVVPDVKVPATEALDEAHRRALAELKHRSESGPSPDPEATKDCWPCEFSPGDKLPAYAFTFELKTDADGKRWITAIDVRSQDKKITQRLSVDDMMPQSPDQPFFFGHEDLNADGLADLSLMTAQGASNGYSQYWLFLPSTGTYKDLGKHPILMPEKKGHRFTSYETGGMAGLLYESNEYALIDNELVITRSETQDVIDEAKHLFRREIRVRKGDKLVLVKSKTIRKR